MQKWTKIALSLLCTAALTACGRAAPEVFSAPPASDGHQHQPAELSATVEHELVGYCGNTITRVSQLNGEETVWNSSFWGSESVELTDFLLYLDYSVPECTCPAEYTVDTELDGGESYGVSLSGGFVRRGGGQADLTQTEAERLRELLEFAAKQQ